MLNNEKSALGGRIKKGIVRGMFIGALFLVVVNISYALTPGDMSEPCVGKKVGMSCAFLSDSGRTYNDRVCISSDGNLICSASPSAACQSQNQGCSIDDGIFCCQGLDCLKNESSVPGALYICKAKSTVVPSAAAKATNDCTSRGGQCSTNGCDASQTAEESTECEGKDLSSICCLSDSSVSGKTSSSEQTGKSSNGIDPFKTPVSGLQQAQGGGNQMGGSGAIAPLTIPNVGLPDPQGGIKQVLENLLRWGLGIIGVLALIGFVVSGIQYIISTGSEDLMESAKRNMLYSIIGIVVVLASFVIIQAINYALEAKGLF